MKNIEVCELEKYNSDNYEKVRFGIYINKSKNNYCFAFKTSDVVEQYPLEDLLDQYSVNCTEYFGDNRIVEVETLDLDMSSFIKIVNFSSIVGKEVVNYSYAGAEYLGSYMGESNFSLNNKLINVPIIANRNDINGSRNFLVENPEMLYFKKFTNGENIDVENFDEVTQIILIDKVAWLVNDTNKCIFNKKGFVSIGE